MAGVLHLRQKIGFVIAAISLLPATISITDAEALLQFKKSLNNSTSLSTWTPGTSPCGGEITWIGVECVNGALSGLRLDSMGLKGPLDVDSLSEVTGLEYVSFMNNSFTGPIPALNRIKNLTAILLSGNKFSGPIPGDFFAGMASLKVIRVSDNQFSGEIPWSVSKIPNLVELGLENNSFSGPIPEIGQKSLTSFNVSNNQLSGEIPRSLQRFDLSSFSGNERLCGMNLRRPCGPGGKRLDRWTAEINEMIERSITLGGAGFFSLVLLAMVYIKSGERRNKFEFDFPEKSRIGSVKRAALEDGHRPGIGSGKRTQGANSELVIVNDEKGVFGMADVMKAGAEALSGDGNSRFGMSYKAVMASGLVVVVKRLKDCNRVGKEEFEMEMRRLGRVKHPNLLTPLAYHYRRDEKLLITEFIPAGSLFHLLHGDSKLKRELNWAMRLIIIKGIARGLSYLHSIFPEETLPHGNLKSSNVLISSNCEPLLSEFGFGPIVNNIQASNLLFAYKAPEAANYNIVNPTCDVYCLGIVILETLTGKFPSQYRSSKGMDVVGWVEACIMHGRVDEALDRGLVINSSPSSRMEMEKLMYIGIDCAERNPELRPTLDETVSRINQIKFGATQDNHICSFESLSTSFASAVPGLDNNNEVREIQAARHSLDEFMMEALREVSWSDDNNGKRKLQNHVNLSNRLRRDGYGSGQGVEQQPAKLKNVQVGPSHHNFYGMMEDLES